MKRYAILLVIGLMFMMMACSNNKNNTNNNENTSQNQSDSFNKTEFNVNNESSTDESSTETSIETIIVDKTNIEDDIQLNETEEERKSAIGYEVDTSNSGYDVPIVIQESDAWKKYIESEYYIDDIYFRHISDDWITGDGFKDDYKYHIEVEYMQGEVIITVAESSNESEYIEIFE